MKYFIALFCMFLSFCVYAGDVDFRAVSQAGWDKLSTAQQAAVVQTITTQSTDVPTASKVDSWVNVGEHIGQALGGAAKEVGVTINAFVQTPVGKLATALIVWKLIGSVVVHVIAGLLIWLIGAAVMWNVFRRYSTVTVTYDRSVVNKFGNHPKLEVVRERIDGEPLALIYLGAFVFVVFGVIVMFTFS